MLHRTNKEIDKEGNVIGGDLKKKCDEFIECLDKFQTQYLSDKFDSTTLSGKDQEKSAKEFQKWAKAKIAQYKSENSDKEKFIQDLKDLKPKLDKCLKLALDQDLDDETILKFMSILSAVYERRCREVDKQNARIASENEKNELIFKREWDKYQSDIEVFRKAWEQYQSDKERYDQEYAEYIIRKKDEYVSFPHRPKRPIKPTPPVLVQKKFVPHPTDTLRLPDCMTYDLMKTILVVVKNRKVNAVKTTDANNMKCCITYIYPMLDMAVKYSRDNVAVSSVKGGAHDIKDWFLKQAGDNIVTKNYLNCLCTYSDEGFPDKVEKLDDIYWTALYLISAKSPNIFSECMQNFKPDKKGSSSTKKWIDRVCRALEKTTKYNGIDKYLEAKLGFMVKAFSTKVPFTLSKRPTIKQKPVQGKIKDIGGTIKEAAQNIKAKLGKEYF